MSATRAWLQLIRLPNTFTALADILAGSCLALGALEWSGGLALLLIASACLYSAGIVINDLRDLETDRRERPHRPLPSGRISVPAARRFAIILIVIGLVAAAAAFHLGQPDASAITRINASFFLALLLICILAYDLFLKSTPIGPICMGACRMLNLLLGMSIFRPDGGATNWYACYAMLIYVAGFTYFGRDEVGGTRRSRLIFGVSAVVVAQLILLVLLGVDFLTRPDALVFWLAWIILTLRAAARAIRSPDPANIQRAMVAFICGIVLLDATLAAAAAGWQAGLIVSLLLLPTTLLGRWLYST